MLYFTKFIKQGFREDIYVISSCGKQRRIITDDGEKKILRNAERLYVPRSPAEECRSIKKSSGDTA